jgi:hypothetical protein
MDQASKLILEIASGPLDGLQITIENETEWRRSETGPLCFPWDSELGEPQARFLRTNKGWAVEGFKAQHGTHLVKRNRNVRQPVTLREGDLLRAHETWILVLGT